MKNIKNFPEYASPVYSGLLPLEGPIHNPIYFPKRKKLKGWQKEMKRNNPQRFLKGKKIK